MTPGDTPELQEFGADARLDRIARIAGNPDELSEEEFAREVDRRIDEEADDAEARRELRRRYGLMPVPPAVPVWTRVLLDPSRGVWAEHFRPDWENRFYEARPVGPIEWTVFDADGTVEATVELPAGFVPHQVTPQAAGRALRRDGNRLRAPAPCGARLSVAPGIRSHHLLSRVAVTPLEALR